jgi:hypothetical protein
MHFDSLCRHLGTVDPEPLAEFVAGLGDDVWHEYKSRQQAFKVHLSTQTIPLVHDDDSRLSNPTVWPRFEQMEPVLSPVLDAIRQSYGSPASEQGFFLRVILTRLSPGGAIPRHRDGGRSLSRSHRHHVAISTNPLVEFFIGDVKHHFAAGEIWEINNRAPHEVRNRSESQRIHLIADYIIPGERIDDPEGTIYA